MNSNRNLIFVKILTLSLMIEGCSSARVPPKLPILAAPSPAL